MFFVSDGMHSHSLSRIKVRGKVMGKIGERVLPYEAFSKSWQLRDTRRLKWLLLRDARRQVGDSASSEMDISLEIGMYSSSTLFWLSDDAAEVRLAKEHGRTMSVPPVERGNEKAQNAVFAAARETEQFLPAVRPHLRYPSQAQLNDEMK